MQGKCGIKSVNQNESKRSSESKVGSGRPKTACTQEKVQHAEEAICSQENPETHRSQTY